MQRRMAQPLRGLKDDLPTVDFFIREAGTIVGRILTSASVAGEAELYPRNPLHDPEDCQTKA